MYSYLSKGPASLPRQQCSCTPAGSSCTSRMSVQCFQPVGEPWRHRSAEQRAPPWRLLWFQQRTVHKYSLFRSYYYLSREKNTMKGRHGFRWLMSVLVSDTFGFCFTFFNRECMRIAGSRVWQNRARRGSPRLLADIYLHVTINALLYEIFLAFRSTSINVYRGFAFYEKYNMLRYEEDILPLEINDRWLIEVAVKLFLSPFIAIRGAKYYHKK